MLNRGSLLAGGWWLVLASIACAEAALPVTGEVTKVHGGFQFTEGPAYDGGKWLYFTDIPAQRIHRTDGKVLEVFEERSGMANGLMFDGKGRLLVCRMAGQLAAVDPVSRKSTVLADRFAGMRFNAPNDLVIDRGGGVYFTDPRFHAPTPLPQGVEAFYYRSAEGVVLRVGEGLAAPNGIILSPDEKTLYVVPTFEDHIAAYPVKSPGVLGPKRILCRLRCEPGKKVSGGDGLAVDVEGNLYVTSHLGVQVVRPDGVILGVVRFPEMPANCAFGGSGRRTLYATCRTGLYSVPMRIAGHVFPGVIRHPEFP